MNTCPINFADVALVLEQLADAIVATGFYDADKVASDFPQEVVDLVEAERALRAEPVNGGSINGWFIRASDLAQKARIYVALKKNG